jgi:hypothetical protein
MIHLHGAITHDPWVWLRVSVLIMSYVRSHMNCCANESLPIMNSLISYASKDLLYDH